MFGIDIAAAVKAMHSFASGIVLPKDVNTGVKVDPDSPTFGFKDMLGEITVRTPSAGTAPTFAVYRGGIYAYSWGTVGGNVEVFVNYHVPHDVVPDGGLYVHANWSVIAAPAGNVNWLFEVAYARGYARGTFEGFPASATTATVSVTAAAVTAFQHEISEVQFAAPGGLINPAVVNVSITSGAATLTSASPLFTAGDIGRTIRVIGAGAAGGNLDTTISAFTSTQQVTTAINAGTTVTAQPNFRYRVIDSDLIEPDGLIMMRGYRDSSRAADTLTVAPFVHFFNMHYQTNGVMGTKNKNYPFYT